MTACPSLPDAEAIYPTGTCFDDALDYVELQLKAMGMERAFHVVRGTRFMVVHAICLMPAGPRAGERYVHAWVEEETPDGTVLAWQGGIYCGVKGWHSTPRDELHAKLRVQQFTRYTLRQVADENTRTGTYGPWAPEYLAPELLKDGK